MQSGQGAHGARRLHGQRLFTFMLRCRTRSYPALAASRHSSPSKACPCSHSGPRSGTRKRRSPRRRPPLLRRQRLLMPREGPRTRVAKAKRLRRLQRSVRLVACHRCGRFAGAPLAQAMLKCQARSQELCQPVTHWLQMCADSSPSKPMTQMSNLTTDLPIACASITCQHSHANK